MTHEHNHQKTHCTLSPTGQRGRTFRQLNRHPQCRQKQGRNYKSSKKELVRGQLNRNVVITQEIADLTKNGVLLDADGAKALAYLKEVLKDTSKVND